MTAERTIQLPPRRKLLKRDCRALVEACGGVEAAALACRAGKSQLSDYGNSNVAAFMPIDVVEDLEAIAEPIVTRGIVERGGYEIDRQAEALPTDVDWCAAIADAAKEYGDAQEKLLRALPDGIQPREIRDGKIMDELAEARRALKRIEALCERALEGEGP